MCFNEYYDGYYIGVCFLFLIPLYVAVGIFCWYGDSKKKDERFWLVYASGLAAISIFLIYVYTIYYIQNDYQGNKYYSGWGEKDEPGNYSTKSKTSYVLEQLCVGMAYFAILIYACFACS